MSRRPGAILIAAAGAALLGAAALSVRPRASREGAPRTVEAALGRIECWSAYVGSLESRAARDVAWAASGAATVTELVPDGARVNVGDVLVRFDASPWEREWPRLERDATLARGEYEALRQAKLPLEVADLEARLAEARHQFDIETEALEACRELAAEDLLSDQEVRQQEWRTDTAGGRVDLLARQLDLTRRYLHPAALQRAAATLASAERELENARVQVSNCVVRAPWAGLVSYRTVPLGGEVRTVRVGDTVYHGQPFMAVSDMSDLVAYADVPEADLTRVQTGAVAVVSPLAFPAESLPASIEAVGSLSQSPAGRSGQRCFRIRAGLAETDPRLRAGMTAHVRVRGYARDQALLIPRAAVWWESGEPFCHVWAGGAARKTALQLGEADETRFEVRGGLEPGARVVVP